MNVNWIDIGAVVLALVYGISGYFTGALRRVIGLGAFLLGLWAGTNLAVGVGQSLQQSFPWSETDARAVAFVIGVVVVLFMTELFTLFNHDRLQFSVVILNRMTGALIGLFTAAVMIIVSFTLMTGYSNPGPGDGAPSYAQSTIHQVQTSSQIAKPMTEYDGLGVSVYSFLQPFLPFGSQRFFNSPHPPVS
ncbi:MAG TPA: CvpA family protein [Candidatus Dormibacteraeota bacterium]|jgi:uncharacterized membrane protein|nr:CvpA family protein [Candidatus Dormibacteraeota bacterium]